MRSAMLRFACAVCTATTVTTAHAHSATPLNPGVCRVVIPQSQPFDCQAAVFGDYLPLEAQARPLRLALDDAVEGSITGCSPPDHKHSVYNGAIVLVRRGGCGFQQKLLNVVQGGGVGMILINSDDADVQLGTLEYERLDAVAVAVKRTEGDRLLGLVNAHGENDGVAVTMGGSTSALDQAWHRIGHLLAINAPFVAHQNFIDALPASARNTLDLLAVLDGNQAVLRDANTMSELVSLALRAMDAFGQLQWEFTREVSLHAAVIVAALSSTSALDVPSARAVTMWLLEGGYYQQAAAMITNRSGRDGITRCLHAFTQFLQGDLLAVAGNVKCLDERHRFNVTVAGLDVPYENFLRLAGFHLFDIDRRCLEMAAWTGSSSDSLIEASNCCQRQLRNRDDGPLPGRNVEHDVRRRSYSYHSSFVEELFHSLNIMGVFMDEIGGFNESLRFFHQASRLCDDWSLSIEFREALAVPIVFESTSAMATVMKNVDTRIENLRRVRKQQERVLSSLTGASDFVEFFSRPEDATYLQYTITPSTMFVGYQGNDVLPLQQSIFRLRSELFLSLRGEEPRRQDRIQIGDDVVSSKRRIAFVSSWFRDHSVGKLILGVIKQLDRSKFHVLVYRSVHFLPYSDEWTAKFRDEADSYMELPANQEDALALLHHEAIDVLIYPELGMDAWLLLLAHHRVAPVQCVFWGHPITTGNPAVDYFISSEFFIADFFEGRPTSSVVDKPGQYHGSSFSEQVVLFQGLSTFFTNPSSRLKRLRPFQREMLHLPANRRLYVCPQTLMKLHPQFDLVLRGILDQDPLAHIILLSSPTQRVWKEHLRRRFQRSLGQHHHRVFFFSTLPYEEFTGLLSTADVILDPFPFGGGVTTLDALAVGTPVITLPSAQTVMQLAAGFLRYVAITDMIVSSIEEYIATAVRVAQDSHARSELTKRILAAHHTLYEDEATVDDWNTFLGSVHVEWPLE